jgi:ABC-type phosphate/phosphonate transport system substrate-binding protein
LRPNKHWLPILSAVLLIAAVAVLLWIARGTGTPRQVNMNDLAQSGVKPRPETVLRVAVATMISPRETENSYFDLLRLVGKHMGREVKFYQRKTYAEVNDLLEHREIDLAFVCSEPYVNGHARFGMELLVVPVVHGGTTYHSYVIVNRDSPIKDLEGLRGKRFAFADPDSNTGYLVPRYMLSLKGETPEHFSARHSSLMATTIPSRP